MPKLAVIAAGVVGVVVVGAGIFVVANQNKPSDATGNGASQSSTKETKVDDPDGTYKLFSDESITKKPTGETEFGNGQTLTFEYDGSKSNNDEYAKLGYELFYIQNNGKVIPMGGGFLTGTGSGEFTTSDSVFKSEANGRSGFLELSVTYGTSASGDGKISGTTTKLGMYPVKFTVSE